MSRSKSRFIYLASLIFFCLALIIVVPIFTKKQKTNEVSKIESPAPETLSAQIENEPKVKGEAAHPIYLGMWTQGFFDPQNFTLHTEALKTLEAKIGKKVAIAHYYRGWEELEKPQVLDELNAIAQNGWRPMISANPYFFDKCTSGGQNLYQAIASGHCDQFMHSAAKNLKNFGKPLFLRFAWEANIDSIEWGVSKVGSTPADFVAAWRKFHDITDAEGATNIAWVFSPNVKGGKSISYKDLYPGGAYVDWIGLDGYNWGTTQPWSSWQTFSQVFASSYGDILKVAPGKPLMIAEVNTTHIGGDKPSWYTDMLEIQLPQNFPSVKAVVFYNENRSAKESVNWQIDISQEALSAFKKGINKSFYLSSF